MWLGGGGDRASRTKTRLSGLNKNGFNQNVLESEHRKKECAQNDPIHPQLIKFLTEKCHFICCLSVVIAENSWVYLSMVYKIWERSE